MSNIDRWINIDTIVLSRHPKGSPEQGIHLLIMASWSRSRCSEDSRALFPRYNRILLQREVSRHTARFSFDLYKITLVGSAASGVNIDGSDQDILIEPRNIIIDECSLRYRHDLPCYVRISTEGLSGLVPNFILGDGKYVSADSVRDMDEDIFGNADGLSKVGKIVNGPRGTMDMVPQIRMSRIPQTARLFSTRDRSWPTDDIVSLISTGEFHLAARPAPSDPDPEHDFCLSFAKAEVMLLGTMSVNQKLSIMHLKIIGRVINFGRGVLTSYHLKTSAQWHFEQTDARLWENDLSVVDILKRLDRYLKGRFLPHYFVPEMNLLTGVSESDLIYFRRRLWTLLGLYLITDDIAGMRSRTRLELAVFILYNVSRQLSETNPASTQTGHMSNIGNILEASEVMYGTGIVAHDLEQRVSASVMARCPIDAVKRRYIDEVKSLLPSFNKTIDLWMYSRQHEDYPYEVFVKSMSRIVDSNKDPLEEFFVITSTGNNKGGRRAVRRALRTSEKIINKWLVFVDDIINKLPHYGNMVADHVLRDISNKSRGDSRVSGIRCEENIDKLLYKITKELLTFAVDHIETLSYPLDNNDTYSFSPVPLSDFLANIRILDDVTERIFLNVEYALVTSARIKASRVSGDQKGRIMQTMHPGSIEYRCISALLALSNVMDKFHNLCSASDQYQGWMEFMAATDSTVRKIMCL